ncbi:MAG: cobaltochelatase subunit CobN [Pseudomonadota bacterium]
MHVVFRESHGLEETDAPTDLGQSPADLVVLSYSDSDLGAFSAGWHRGQAEGQALPTLRLANISALRHPLSVDTYIERTLAGAKGILVRLIGGAAYWSYGLQQIAWLAAREGIALAVLPADGRPDPQLDAASTVPASTLHRLKTLCDAGGPVATQAALAQLALAAGLYAAPVRGAKGLGPVGAWTPAAGLACPAAALMAAPARPRVLVVFYRSYLTAADLDPVRALIERLEGEGFAATGLFAPSLKAPEAAAWLRRWVAALAPAAIVNATAFSARDRAGATPLDAAGVPVFQVALSTAPREAWAGSDRGLSPADLAMHVVLPEVDGRVFAGVVSFKQPGRRDPALEFARWTHAAEPDRIGATARRIAGWTALAARPAAARRLALVLSSYPGKAWQRAHAIGLDAIASAEAILEDLAAEGYATAPAALAAPLGRDTLAWPIADYRAALATLPAGMRRAIAEAWGAPEEDPAARDGALHFPAFWQGNVLVALQPERGETADRKDSYHDLARVPRHAYAAFYLWLQSRGLDAMLHLGAHGTLEWLPGKSAALSDTCWPERLTGALPVIYPFIVNDPGEAAQAKRRIGAVTIGHVPPPLRRAGPAAPLSRLEALLDEFSNADGLDPARRDRLQGDIREEARAVGLEADLGLAATDCPLEAITRIDRFVCDVKDSQFGDGLHVFARASTAFPERDCAAAERRGLLDALAGRRVAPGPSGSPHRGRLDVLPTGRNLYTTDPRAVPSRAAHAQGVRLAEELLRRHLQDEGEPLARLVVDLWGSATMRTAGEELAMALHLMGVSPVWDEGSERVGGITVLPITELDHPRVDVTLRVSGLFRDVFAQQMALFGQAVRALAGRDEPVEWNPFAGRDPGARVYGPAPGTYGIDANLSAGDYSEAARAAAGEAWLAASAHAFDAADAPDRAGIEARVAAAQAFVHLQDLPETDLLTAADYASHEAGFAAARARLGGAQAALYHIDATDPAALKARSLREEIARTVRARAANPAWIAGMMRHGFRGGAEIAATLDHLAAFAHLARLVEPHLFDLYHDATLGSEDVTAFLAEANPEALAAMRATFAALREAGLWQTRRNSILATLEAPVEAPLEAPVEAKA